MHIITIIGETKANFLFPNSSVLSIEQCWFSIDRIESVTIWRRALAQEYGHQLLNLQRDLI